MSDIDTLVDQIDARGLSHWDLYRGAHVEVDATGAERQVWVVKLTEADGGELTNRDVSLSSLLEWATTAQFLPIVPRRPIVTSHWEVRKAGPGRWEIVADGYRQVEYPTKKAAEERIEAAKEAQREAAYDWDTEWAQLVATGTEDVDFRWKS